MNELLMTGKWVRQYQKGIWKVVDIKPKIAFEDYCGEELSRYYCHLHFRPPVAKLIGINLLNMATFQKYPL